MASWREIDRIRKDIRGFRDLAARLLLLPPGELTEWEAEFCESITGRLGVEEFTTLQGEKLLQIRDGAETHTTIRGFSVKALIRGCFEGRADLSEADEEWIAQQRAIDVVSIKRRHAGRLLRCAAQLGLIEELESA